MKILTGEPTGSKRAKALDRGIGCMICTSRRKHLAGPRHQAFQHTAMDNGAYGCWLNNRPFNGEIFLENIERSKILELDMLFVVCPDIVKGGTDSLDFSMQWRCRIDYPRVALVIQEGMTKEHVDPVVSQFQYIFMGGGPWKWNHLEYWVDYAHGVGLPIHVGECGKLWMLQAANRFGVDSVDSTSWAVNDTFHIVDEFLNPKQMELAL